MARLRKMSFHDRCNISTKCDEETHKLEEMKVTKSMKCVIYFASSQQIMHEININLNHQPHFCLRRLNNKLNETIQYCEVNINCIGHINR